jgi:cation:H+ antiporter
MPDWYSNPGFALATIFLVVGFYMLIKGADILVEGAVVIARKAELSPAVVGATVVAFGTSLPELVVSVGSNIKAISSGSALDPNGPAAIAIGNIVGSNIFNIGAILGISAFFSHLEVPPDTRRRDYPIMLGALFAMVFFSVSGEPYQIDRTEAAILFVGLILFTFQAIKLGKAEVSENNVASKEASIGPALILLGIGIVMLGLGGEISLTGAIAISRELGLSERVIGLTIMAIGTSLPELATSIQASRKGHHAIAVANVVGSNIFNVFCIIGISGMIIPLSVHPAMLGWDFFWMCGFSLSMAWCFWVQKRIGKIAGGILVFALCTYVGILLFKENASFL